MTSGPITITSEEIKYAEEISISYNKSYDDVYFVGMWSPYDMTVSLNLNASKIISAQIMITKTDCKTDYGNGFKNAPYYYTFTSWSKSGNSFNFVIPKNTIFGTNTGSRISTSTKYYPFYYKLIVTYEE